MKNYKIQISIERLNHEEYLGLVEVIKGANNLSRGYNCLTMTCSTTVGSQPEYQNIQIEFPYFNATRTCQKDSSGTCERETTKAKEKRMNSRTALERFTTFINGTSNNGMANPR